VALELIAQRGIGVETAAQLLITAGDNPDRLHHEAAFAHFCSVAPIPASSWQTRRFRLNRAGDRGANRALHMIALTRRSLMKGEHKVVPSPFRQGKFFANLREAGQSARVGRPRGSPHWQWSLRWCHCCWSQRRTWHFR
jgi:transposase